MEKNAALIGYTGFVGRNILNQQQFTHLYNSKNIEEIQGKEFDLIVCAGAPGVKWIANKEPGKDYDSIKRLMDCLKKVKTKEFVLISTINVYSKPSKVDEDTPIEISGLLPYGKHRRILEQFAESRFSATIIRLPGLFGEGIKKNMIYDLLNYNRVETIQEGSIFQFYNLDYIWMDINKTLQHNIKILNLATEPVSAEELGKYCFGFDFTHKTTKSAPHYDMRTKYGVLWGQNSSYLYPKLTILQDLKSFVINYKQGISAF